MKRNILYALLSLCVTSALTVSCEPMEPASHTETFHRLATVRYKDDKASMVIDYTGEVFALDNFKTQADMQHFGVIDGDRVIAKFTFEAIGNIGNSKLYLDEIVRKYPKLSLAKSRPADSLNYAYRFNTLSLISVRYPTAWATGHVVNLAPEYYATSTYSKADFKLYPTKVQGDTLMMDLYADIPDTVNSWEMQQKFLCFDISTLRKTVSDPVEQAHRDSLLSKLTALKEDTITVQIFAPDIMRKWIIDKDKAYHEIQFKNIRTESVEVAIPFDF